MILPDAQRVWTCVHEAAHAVAFEAFGVEVRSIEIREDGSGATSVDPAAALPVPQQLVILAAGAAAVSRRWPEWRLLSAATGCSDFERIEATLLAHVHPEDHHRARLATLSSVERFVAEYEPEISALAGKLLVGVQG